MPLTIEDQARLTEHEKRYHLFLENKDLIAMTSWEDPLDKPENASNQTEQQYQEKACDLITPLLGKYFNPMLN
jgi:hypothetical protein